MGESLLKHLEGKAPQICFDHLYAAIYVVARNVIQGGFPLDIAVDKLNQMQEKVVEELMK